MKYSIASNRKSYVLGLPALLIALMLITANEAAAQRAPGAVGIGAQIGEPSGVTLMIYNPQRMSYDFLAAWDMDDFFFLNTHALFEQHFGQSNRAHFFYGPGAFIGIRDRSNDADDEVVVGVSGRVGVGYLFDRFEVYAQLTPRLALSPSTNGDFGGGVGFRFYLN